ncbi:MAG: cobyrinate a,c-diamide synthase [Vulcanimicrobiaceae bacterium]
MSLDGRECNCPALLVTAPGSAQGKTTIAAALARLHARAGRRVRVFKCGPDFLDPQILAVAAGSPVYNLDLWMCGESDGAERLHRAAGEADLILVEGVMGLHDGTPSSADLARRFGLPLLVVIDASAMAQTFGAIVHGLTEYVPGLTCAGALANRVESDGHAELLRQSLPAGTKWFGHVSPNAEAALPERHLGLVQASEVPDLLARLDRLADALAATDADSLPPPVAFREERVPAPPPLLRGKTIAVARDLAFAFTYQANLDCLEDLGARIRYFSPLVDPDIPAADAVWLPGGYPELHAAELSANRSMLASLRRHVGVGKPMLAECGGMMLLFDRLLDATGDAHAVAGVLPGSVSMQPRLGALGLQSVDFGNGAIRGHTFHYSRVNTPLTPLTHAERSGGGHGEAVWRLEGLTASYVHLYFPSNPVATAALFLS